MRTIKNGLIIMREEKARVLENLENFDAESSKFVGVSGSRSLFPYS